MSAASTKNNKGETIMNKRSQWILILSLLLCLMILFVACDKGDTSEDAETTDQISETESATQTTTEEETQTQTQEPTPENESVDYASIIQKWGEYVEYAEPETLPQYKLEQLFTDKDSNTAKVTVAMHHGYIATVKTTYSSYDTLGAEVSRSYKYDVYNLTTASKIFTLLTSSYDPSAEEEHLKISPVTYDIRFVCDAYGRFTGIIEIKKGTLTNTEEDPEQAPVYEYVYTYAYYDTKGNLIGSKLEAPAAVSFLYDDSTVLVTVGEACYVSRDGKIIFSCDKGQERAIPHFDVEYNGFKYVVTNERLVIYDTEYNRVADYAIYTDSSVYRQDFMMLGNGDVVIEQIFELPYNAAEFDYECPTEYGVQKYSVNTVIVSATTGKATQVDVDFIFNAFANQLSDGDKKITLKSNDCNYAEIRRFTDGALSSEVEFVILDNSLEAVANLPKIVKNQTSVYEFTDASHVIVEATTPEGTNIFYSVDISIKSIREYYDVKDDPNYTALAGGYIYRDILYNNDGERLYDLRNVISYNVVEGGETLCVIEQYGLDGDTLAYDKSGNPIYPADSIVRIKVMYIDNTDDIYVQSTVIDQYNMNYNADGFYYSSVDGYTVWDKYGNEILYADVTGLTQIADQCYLVTCSKTVSEYLSAVDGYVEVTYTEYYIMK